MAADGILFKRLKLAFNGCKLYFGKWLREYRTHKSGKIHEYDFWFPKLLWRDLLGNKFFDISGEYDAVDAPIIKPGHTIKISEAHLSDWIPLMPGDYFTMHHDRIGIEQSFELLKEDIYHYRSSNAYLRTGNACIRLLPYENHYLMSAAHPNSVSQGIPLIVTKKTYEEKIQDLINKKNVISANIEATLIPLTREWVKELDSIIPSSLITILPKYVLRLEKITQIGEPEFLNVTFWTGFKLQGEEGFCSKFTSLTLPHKCEWIVQGIKENLNKLGVKPLFDCDEVQRRFESALWIPSSKFGLKSQSDTLLYPPYTQFYIAYEDKIPK